MKWSQIRLSSCIFLKLLITCCLRISYMHIMHPYQMKPLLPLTPPIFLSHQFSLTIVWHKRICKRQCIRKPIIQYVSIWLFKYSYCYLAIREMEIKTALRFHLSPIRMAKIKKLIIIKNTIEPSATGDSLQMGNLYLLLLEAEIATGTGNQC